MGFVNRAHRYLNNLGKSMTNHELSVTRKLKKIGYDYSLCDC